MGLSTVEQTLDWSHTRARTLRECPRRYFYRYHLAADGWKKGVRERVRHAYRLSMLTTLDLVLGKAIHGCAARMARAVLTRAAFPDPQVLRDEVRRALNHVWRNGREPDAFFADSRRHPVLVDVYYDRGPGEAAVERTRDKLDCCLANLIEAPVWKDLMGCDVAAIHVVDTPGAVSVEGITLWAAPDLVYTRPDGRTVLLDWKTGRTTMADAQAQLALYALYVEETFPRQLPGSEYHGEVYDLSSGQAMVVPLAAGDLAAARTRMLEEVADLRERLGTGDAGQAPPAAAFPLCTQRFRCCQCSFWEFCEAEINPSTLQPR